MRKTYLNSFLVILMDGLHDEIIPFVEIIIKKEFI